MKYIDKVLQALGWDEIQKNYLMANSCPGYWFKIDCCRAYQPFQKCRNHWNEEYEEEELK